MPVIVLTTVVMVTLTAMDKMTVNITDPNPASPLAHIGDRAPLVCVRVVTLHTSQAGGA